MILRQSNIEGLKGVRRLKAIPPNFAVKNPTEKHIWKFAVSVVDTISMMATVEQRKLINNFLKRGQIEITPRDRNL